jgi:nucleoside-diphosphate-sugar epimerase
VKIAVTGANSSVGEILLRHLIARSDIQVVACVRSKRAMANLPADPSISARVIDYTDRLGLAAALDRISCVVHLAGILIESPSSNYQTANVDATRAVVEACKRERTCHTGDALVARLPKKHSGIWERVSGCSIRQGDFTRKAP